VIELPAMFGTAARTCHACPESEGTLPRLEAPAVLVVSRPMGIYVIGTGS
jgi:hypothetical protein